MDASKLIRAHVSEGARLPLYCLRHTWWQRARRLKIEEDLRRAIMGHSEGDDDHDLAYIARPPVSELQPAIDAVAEHLLRDFRIP